MKSDWHYICIWLTVMLVGIGGAFALDRYVGTYNPAVYYLLGVAGTMLAVFVMLVVMKRDHDRHRNEVLYFGGRAK